MPQKSIEPFAAVTSARTLSKGQEDPGFTAVQDFLLRFGYLRPNTFKANQLDEPTEEGLLRFQRQHGLPPPVFLTIPPAT